MLLQSLTKLYESYVQKGEIDKLGWSPVKVSYGVCLDIDGAVTGVISLKERTADGKKLVPSLYSLPMPVKKSSGVTSNFLYESASYIFGYDNSGKPDRALKAFEACKKLHLYILKDCNDEYSQAIKNFFSNNFSDIQTYLVNIGCTDDVITDILQKGATLLFMPLGKFPTDSPQICEAWDRHYANSNSPKGVCLVTGKNDHIAILHPSIKNVRGAQPSGASLVSFNATAFESFEKTQGFNAPVSEYAAFAYSSALNKLLADKEHKQFIGDTTVVCWTEDAEPAYQDIFFGFFSNDNTIPEKDLWDIIKKVAHGKHVEWNKVNLNPDNDFYILGLSPNSSRLSVRFFIRNSFGNIMKNCLLHEQRMEIVKPSFDTREHISLWQMLSETVNPKSKDKSCKPHLAGDVLNSILNGTNYPQTLFYGVQNRISAERNISRGKAAIIKAFILKNYSNVIPKEEVTVELNENAKNKAYILGVLFSNLEEIQNKANPNIKATIRDKYFASASSTPAMVFPLLIELAQNHIKKISETGNKIYCQKMLTDTMSKLGNEFPVRLSLQEKGMFQLGYYHQTQKRFTTKEEKYNG